MHRTELIAALRFFQNNAVEFRRGVIRRARVCVALFTGLLASSVFALPTTLDTTFGSGLGKVSTSVFGTNNTAGSIVLQPDGKIVLVGGCQSGSSGIFCAARYNADGSLDTSFNATGKVFFGITSVNDSANGAALQPDGKILMAGRCTPASGIGNFCVARLLSTGALDSTFGTNGHVNTAVNAGNESGAYAIALQPDGKIVLAGNCTIAGVSSFCAVRYLSDGTFDTTFATGGRASTQFVAGTDTYADSVAIQPDGRIVLSGVCKPSTFITVVRLCVARFTSAGALDSTFASVGKYLGYQTQSVGNSTRALVQPDGRLLIAATCTVTNPDATVSGALCAFRLTAGGVADTTFGSGGLVATSAFYIFRGSFDAALQPDGKILIGGYARPNNTDAFGAARLNSDGSFDTSFSATGTVTTTVSGSNDRGQAIALQPDGKILLAGSCNVAPNGDFCMLRFEGGPLSYQACSLDIDGDGQVLATTDSLIHARIALGITGNAVIGGITFPATAKRTTWAAIRAYLITQCGMSLVQ